MWLLVANGPLDRPDNNTVSWRTQHFTTSLGGLVSVDSVLPNLDPRFGEAFFDGSWMAGVDQEAMLRQVACPTVYLKATTRYGDDGVLYAATTDDDAARVRECLANCEYIEIDSGHDIHAEHPDRFIEAVAQAV